MVGWFTSGIPVRRIETRLLPGAGGVWMPVELRGQPGDDRVLHQGDVAFDGQRRGRGTGERARILGGLQAVEGVLELERDDHLVDTVERPCCE